MKKSKTKAKPAKAKAVKPAPKPAKKSEAKPIPVRVVSSAPPGHMVAPGSVPQRVKNPTKATRVRNRSQGLAPGQPTADNVPGEIKGDETAYINGGAIPPRVDHPGNRPARVYLKHPAPA